MKGDSKKEPQHSTVEQSQLRSKIIGPFWVLEVCRTMITLVQWTLQIHAAAGFLSGREEERKVATSIGCTFSKHSSQRSHLDLLQFCKNKQMWVQRGVNDSTIYHSKLYIPSTLNTDPYLLASSDCGGSEVSNHALNHGLFLSLLKLFGWKCILDWIKNSGFKSSLLHVDVCTS